MKIVIDISEEDFEYLNQFRDIVDEIVKNKRNNGSDNINYAVLHGTLLPKGHGRLIDADKLIKDTSVGEMRDNEGALLGYQYIIKEDVSNAPTIIEADKE